MHVKAQEVPAVCSTGNGPVCTAIDPQEHTADTHREEYHLPLNQNEDLGKKLLEDY